MIQAYRDANSSPSLVQQSSPANPRNLLSGRISLWDSVLMVAGFSPRFHLTWLSEARNQRPPSSYANSSFTKFVSPFTSSASSPAAPSDPAVAFTTSSSVTPAGSVFLRLTFGWGSLGGGGSLALFSLPTSTSL